MNQSESAIQRGYRLLARTVINIAFADLKSGAALRNEAIAFFESGSHFSLFCDAAQVDPDDIYARYVLLAGNNE